MSNLVADVVICGAGIAGISTAYNLVCKYGVKNVLLVDPEPPLSVTSDKSFEAYRNWWPGPDDAMVALSNHSIDLLEEMHREKPDVLHMNRRGYIFVSANADKIPEVIKNTQDISRLGAGEVRVHNCASSPYIPSTAHGLFDAPEGADILIDKSLIQKHFPYLPEDAVSVLHTRCCGWFAARQVGMDMLERARAKGLDLLQGKVTDVETKAGSISGVQVSTDTTDTFIETNTFVNAAGPFQKEVATFVDVDLPVHAELHMKIAFEDLKSLIPRDMPMAIWTDPIRLEWSEEEKTMLAEDKTHAWLLDEQPPLTVIRPDSGVDSTSVLGQWEYRLQPDKPIFPLPIDTAFPEYVLRGLSRMIPALKPYLEQLPKTYMDGGYYVRTQENRPIIGPLGDIKGSFGGVALSGTGMKLGPAVGELLAQHIVGAELPSYADAFRFERFADSDYMKLIAELDTTGNL